MIAVTASLLTFGAGGRTRTGTSKARQILMVSHIGAAPTKVTGHETSVVSTNSTTPAWIHKNKTRME